VKKAITAIILVLTTLILSYIYIDLPDETPRPEPPKVIEERPTTERTTPDIPTPKPQIEKPPIPKPEETPDPIIPKPETEEPAPFELQPEPDYPLCTFYPLTPKHNEKTNPNKINIVFTGDNFNHSQLLKQLVNKIFIDEDRDGNLLIPKESLMDISPLKENHNQFNYWYVPKIQHDTNIHINSCFCLDVEVRKQLQQCGMKNMEFISLCNQHCSPIAGINDHYLHLGKPMQWKGKVKSDSINAMYYTYSGILAHEFGHSFAGLYDEYISGEGDFDFYPNCAPDEETAQQWWGNIFPNLKTYKGCVTENTYRFHESSIMKEEFNRNFGYLNEHIICKKIKEITGTVEGQVCSTVN
tara:strand:- start:6767 stop:7831 length:1065 start_codon:yes stop_codon:yes gene_type:complete